MALKAGRALIGWVEMDRVPLRCRAMIRRLRECAGERAHIRHAGRAAR